VEIVRQRDPSPVGATTDGIRQTKEIAVKIVHNIKGIRIDWLKVAEAFGAANPYGPIIGPDGTIYSPDGRMLSTGVRGAPVAPESDAAAAPVRHNPRPALGVRINDRAIAV
jgi:hypothetical protein